MVEPCGFAARVYLLPLHILDEMHSFWQDSERELEDVVERVEIESIFLIEHWDCFTVSIHT
jgi:hypothetical protein